MVLVSQTQIPMGAQEAVGRKYRFIISNVSTANPGD